MQVNSTMPDYAFFRGNVELGSLTFEGGDFPWEKGTFIPTADFDDVRELFDELYESVNGGKGKFHEIWNRITEPGVYLQSLRDGNRLTKFTLHIRRGKFRLRVMEKRNAPSVHQNNPEPE
jgi:hypothetical protein